MGAGAAAGRRGDAAPTAPGVPTSKDAVVEPKRKMHENIRETRARLKKEAMAALGRLYGCGGGEGGGAGGGSR